MTDKVLREPEVAEATGLGRTARYNMEREGKFPKRRKLGARAVGWIKSEVDEWVANREVVDLANDNDEVAA